MHQKSTLPTTEVTVLPIRTAVSDHGEDRQPVPPIEPQVSPKTKGAEDVEAYQADRALHAMLARLSGGISPAALLLAYTDWLSHLASSPQRQMKGRAGARLPMMNRQKDPDVDDDRTSLGTNTSQR